MRGGPVVDHGASAHCDVILRLFLYVVWWGGGVFFIIIVLVGMVGVWVRISSCGSVGRYWLSCAWVAPFFCID